MTVNWSTKSNICWTCGKLDLKFISDKDPVYSSFEDVSAIIKLRAFSQYGIKVQLFIIIDIILFLCFNFYTLFY